MLALNCALKITIIITIITIIFLRFFFFLLFVLKYNTLAWKIPWAEKPGRLQSMESETTERLHFHFSLSCIGEGNGNPLQCSCLENPRDGGAWWAAVYGVAQSQTRLKWLSSSSIVALLWYKSLLSFPGGSDGKESACNVRNLGSIPGSGRSPGDGNGNPLQFLAWRIPWTEEPGGV